MARYVGLLRAVNVGGTGKLAMRDLAAICAASGFANVRTYIQSGNVVFDSRLSAEKAKATLERALATKMGAPLVVVIVEGEALVRVLRSNPFPQAPGAQVVVFFSTDDVPKSLLCGVSGPAGEQVVPGIREFYVHYPEGQGRSKLKLPKLPGAQTARNLNTVATLVTMLRES